MAVTKAAFICEQSAIAGCPGRVCPRGPKKKKNEKKKTGYFPQDLNQRSAIGFLNFFEDFADAVLGTTKLRNHF